LPVSEESTEEVVMSTFVDSSQAKDGVKAKRIRTWSASVQNLISLPLLAFVTIVVLLGVNFVAVRFSNAELPPFWGAALRFTIASVVLFMIVLFRRLPLPRGMGLVGASLYGLLVFGFTYAFLYWALLYVPPGIASMTSATIPLITLFIAVSLKLERLTGRGILGGILVLIGMGIVFQEQLQAEVPPTALVALILGPICAALSGIVIKRFPRSHPISTNAVAMAVGAVLLVVISRGADETWHLPVLPETLSALAWLIMSAIVAFILMVWLLSKWNASAVSYSTVLMPLVTVPVASLLAGELVTLAFVVGGAFALGGVYFGALTAQTDSRPKPQAVDEESEAKPT
jgi:drug/metabolite transporter (DMT)-like permease